VISIIPTSTREDVSSYTQRTALDGTEYVIAFDWNDREQHWYMDIADREGVAIATGIKVVCDWPLLRRCVDGRAPAGAIIAIDQSGSGADPGLTDLGARVELLYLDAEELGG